MRIEDAAPTGQPSDAWQPPLALHAWSLDSTPLADVLRIAGEAGWDAVELRRKDLERARAAGWSVEQLGDHVRASNLRVASVGVEAGWVFADGAEQQRLFGVMAESCRTAVALGCDVVMSPVGEGRGTVAQAAASLRAAGDVVGEHGL